MAFEEDKFIAIDSFIDEFWRVFAVRAKNNKITHLESFYLAYSKKNHFIKSLDPGLLAEYLMHDYEKNNKYREYIAAGLYRIITKSGFLINDQYEPSLTEMY
jgi:hypothetical protein